MKKRIILDVDEINELYGALGEVLDFFKKSSKHQKVHKNNKCGICEGYKKLMKKLEKYCNGG